MYLRISLCLLILGMLSWQEASTNQIESVRQRINGGIDFKVEDYQGKSERPKVRSDETKVNDEFQWQVDRFADLRVLRYQIDGFNRLPIKQKLLAYYLSQAGLSGRDIFWDQHYKHNLRIRRTLEEIVKHYSGDRDSQIFKQFMVYTKRVWFSNGIHHHYSSNKLLPDFSYEDFLGLVKKSRKGEFPVRQGKNIKELLIELKSLIFDSTVDGKMASKTQGVDKVVDSAVNFYENVSELQVYDYYQKKAMSNKLSKISWGLNSKLIEKNGTIKELKWKIGGMYSKAIERIVYWLERALTVTENNKQHKALELLIQYYKSGNLEDFDQYNIAWVQDIHSDIDFINSFIEVYDDPMAYRGSYEAVISIRDKEATKRIATIAANAQWFEDHSPIMDEHKKKNVKGISGKSIIVVMESGASSPASPIGINLPNADWIRSQYGSKSVSLANIKEAIEAAKGGLLKEFAWDQQEIELSKKYSQLVNVLTTDTHEVIGHASGKINKGVGTPKETLKQYASTLEEARADLVGLYYLPDQKLVDIGVSPSTDVGKVAYDGFIRANLLMQLNSIKQGEHLEQDHMRGRQLIAKWVMEKGAKDNVIVKQQRDGKSYFEINDYKKLRVLFGQLLRKIQKIKSEGDFAAAEYLVETYGVKVDEALRKEAVSRYKKLNRASFTGFLNPRLVPVYKGKEIVDIKVVYPKTFVEQMLHYAEHYSFLPNDN